MQPINNKISSYIIQSQEQEIKRIANELHEGVGQTLYSLYTGIQFIETAISQKALKEYAGDMTQMLEKAIQEVRHLAVELHPPTLTTLGLLSALKSYLKIYTLTYGIEVELRNSGDEVPLTEKENITLFRVCQEALANIARYADAMKAEILFTWQTERLTIIIRDTGKGFDVETTMNQSTGLASMVERMYLIGGNCKISSKIKEGTFVEFSLPL